MILIVGGGLAGSLLAYQLSRRRPDLEFLLLESASTLGGEHTWSFHESDLTPEQMEWVRPFLSGSWKGTRVEFPGLKRDLPGNYHSVISSRFHAMLFPMLGESVRFGTKVKSVETQSVVLESGECIKADCVIDARGFAQVSEQAGFQKFFGLDVKLTAPHGVKLPVIMDATCRQEGGFRFFYLLPWDDTSILIEDTRYSDTPSIDRAAMEAEVLAYTAARKWTVREVVRREAAALPIPLVEFPQEKSRIPKIGVRGGFFHDVTGYSFPWAVRVADHLCDASSWNAESLIEELDRFRARDSYPGSFYRLLNRMLFRAAKPEERYKILERFYGLPEGLVRRFYAGKTTWPDRARILCGKPPVPILKAIRCLGS